MNPGTLCPQCQALRARPDVAWFGEVPYQMHRIAQAVAQSDLFVAIGTLAAVYPAAGLVELALRQTLEINLDPPARANAFDAHRFGPATEVVPDWVATLI